MQELLNISIMWLTLTWNPFSFIENVTRPLHNSSKVIQGLTFCWAQVKGLVQMIKTLGRKSPSRLWEKRLGMGPKVH